MYAIYYSLNRFCIGRCQFVELFLCVFRSSHALCEAEAPIHCAQAGFSRRATTNSSRSTQVPNLSRNVGWISGRAEEAGEVYCFVKRDGVPKRGTLGGFRGEQRRRARSTDAIMQRVSISARASQSGPSCIVNLYEDPLRSRGANSLRAGPLQGEKYQPGPLNMLRSTYEGSCVIGDV